MFNINLKRVFTTLIVILLTGCATPQSEPELTANEKLANYLNQGELITGETDRGLVVYLPSLFFETGSAELKPAAQDKIRYIGNAINEEYVAGRNIAIEGHTDSVGEEEFNLNLSKLRAEAVVKVHRSRQMKIQTAPQTKMVEQRTVGLSLLSSIQILNDSSDTTKRV